MNIDINKEKLEMLVKKFDDEIRNLEIVYEQLGQKMKLLDGNGDIWKGSAQKEFYKYWEELAKNFPDTVREFTDYKEFLNKVIINYSSSEESINNDIEKNADNFTV